MPYKTPIIRLEGLPETIKVLKRRMKRLESFHSPLTQVAEDFFSLQQGWLDSEGRGAWTPLTLSYAKWKRNRVGEKPMMQLTGDMYADMTGGTRGGIRIRRDSLVVRATKSGARWIDHSRGRGRRPKRQIVSPAVNLRKRYWHRMITKWIES